MILIAEINISIYLVLAVAIGILSISVNIFGKGRNVNGNGYIMYLSVMTFLTYLILLSLVYFYHQISQPAYYLTYITMMVLILSITIILMKEYSGSFMKKHVASLASYSMVVIFLSLVTLIVHPGKPYLLDTYIFGFQALPSSTVLLHTFFIIPIVIVLTYSLFYTIFKNGFERTPLYLSLGALTLIATNGFKEYGALYIMDLMLLIVSILLILGFSGMKVSK